MGLCRFLPTPSDRMGLLWTLLTIKESVILEYGPAGTTHYSMGFLGKLGIDYNEQIFSTHMSEDDVIMGDVSRLENSLVELDENFSPKVIFVVASSTSEVIGTDIKGVCRYMQPDINAKIIPCDVGGFRGDYSIGVSFGYNAIVKNLVKEAEKTNTFNIIGLSVGNFRAFSDKNEIVRLMKETYGLELSTTLCAETTVTQIENMSQAKVNLVVGVEGLAAAKHMEKKFGVPYVYGVPYGYEGTKQWLMQVSEAIDSQPNPAVMGEIGKKIMGASHYKMYGMMLKKTLKVAVIGDYDRVVGLSQAMENLGAQVETKICLHTLRGIENPAEDILYFKEETDRIAAIEQLNDTFVLCDEVSAMLLNDTNTSMCVNSPMVFKSQVATHLPIVGVHGIDMIRESYDEYLRHL
ncbi:MAG: hypothetical protein ATN35_04850 [Epulopiscium sp. Nele67-Bin004]|nr:MAG: hypothetical protein ATN35_04850 [Epulopiscium sp. Nele67-Bin004]